MTISDLSIRKPVFAWMLMAALLLFGAIGYERLGLSQDPDIDFPVVNIRVSWEGAAPEVMENEVIDVIEESLMTVEGIIGMSSTSRFGSGTVTAEFTLDKDIDVAVQEVQTKLAQARRNLPVDIDPPIIGKVNPEDQPILWVGVSGSRPYKEIAQYVRDHLKDRFQTLPGVGEITLGGYTEPNIRLWLDPQRMQKWEITVDDVISAVAMQHAELPAGVIQTAREEMSVRVMGEAASVEEIGNLRIPSRVGGGALWKTVRLKDIADVEDGLEDIRRISRVNGEPAVGLGIRKQRGSNAVAVADAVKRRIEEVSKDLPPGLKVGVNFDSTRFIEDNVHELLMTLLLAVLFTSIVCWFFLGSLSSTLNVFLAIPTALGGAFASVYFFGFTLNTITLLALSLVVGIVVDDAVVVMENIVRHREQGKSRIRAAIEGTREITFAVIVISSSVVAIFLPVAFMEDVIGKYFFQFGVTISMAVAFSLVEALTIAPMRCSQFLTLGRETRMGRFSDRFVDSLIKAYRTTLAWALKWRLAVIAAAVCVFVLSLLLLSVLRREMTPSVDQGIFLARLEAPPGSSLSHTDAIFRQAEGFLMQRPEVDRYFGAIGGFGGGQVSTGVLFITLKEKRDRPVDAEKGRPLTQQEFMDVVRPHFQKIPGIRRVALQEVTQGGIGGGRSRGFPIQLSIRGPDWEKLGEYAEDIRTRLLDSGMAQDVRTDYLLGVPEVKIYPDRERAGARGVTTASVARTVNATIGGVRVGKYTKGGRRYDVRVSVRDRDRSSPADVGRLWVRNLQGELVRLSEVTRIVEQPTLLTVNREDRQRSVTVSGNVMPGRSQAVVLEAAGRIAAEVLPEGYTAVETGAAQTFRKSFRELIFALFLGVAIAYMILGGQFNSFIHPFTVLLALPFSLSGALIALYLAGQSLNLYSMIGILLLMGIVKKNSVLLVDFTNARRDQGMGVHEALLAACPLRLRPILMTSLTMVSGALPAALTIGPGAELRSPMGVAVIGGTLLSMLLTLYVVPCAYSLLTGLEPKGKEKRQAEVRSVLIGASKNDAAAGV